MKTKQWEVVKWHSLNRTTNVTYEGLKQWRGLKKHSKKHTNSILKVTTFHRLHSNFYHFQSWNFTWEFNGRAMKLHRQKCFTSTFLRAIRAQKCVLVPFNVIRTRSDRLCPFILLALCRGRRGNGDEMYNRIVFFFLPFFREKFFLKM